MSVMQDNPTMPAGLLTKSSWVVRLASITVIIAALYLAKGVLVPLTLAVLLSFLLSPLCDWLERLRIGRVPAVLVTGVLGFSLLGLALWIAAIQMTGLAPKIPEYQKNIEAKLNSVNAYAVTALGNMTSAAQGMGEDLSIAEQSDSPRGTSQQPFSVRVLSSPPSPLQVFGGIFGTVLEALGTAGIVVVLVMFFLLRREDLRDRFIHLVGKGHVTVTTQVLEDAAMRVSRYLSMLFLINVTFGLAVGIGLSLIGVPNAILWGILAAALRFIPYIGPWIAAAMPIGLSLAISTGWIAPLLTISLFVVLELISNNVIEPWLYGRNTGVSAVAVLVAAVFWLWLWGPVGLLLATPLTVCVLVVGKHVPQLSFLHILLGTEPVFEPKTRIYQRLLAGDQEEAAALIDDYLERQSLVEVYDTVLIPALALAERHWHRGEVVEGRHSFILQSLKEIIEDLGERQQELLTEASVPSDNDGGAVSAANAKGSPVRIVCLPARDEADEIAAAMLAQNLESMGCQVETVALTARAGEMIDRVEQGQATVVCVSATPPNAVMHARYLCRRLRARMPNVHLVVGLWDAPGDLTTATNRIGKRANAQVVSTLAAAQEKVSELIRTYVPECDTPGLPALERTISEPAYA